MTPVLFGNQNYSLKVIYFFTTVRRRLSNAKIQEGMWANSISLKIKNESRKKKCTQIGTNE